MQMIKLEIINNAVDIIEITQNLAAQGFDISVKAVGATATIVAKRYFDGEPEIEDEVGPTIN
ncbi:hypothetical protein D9M71_357800 [compost metagenome]